MAWRVFVSGIALAAALFVPLAIDRPAAALDEVVILSRYRSFIGANMPPRKNGHPGVDFAERLGAPVLAAADGIVSGALYAPLGCGNGVTFPVSCLHWVRWR